MKPIIIPVEGETADSDEGLVLLLHWSNSELNRPNPVFLRLAFVTRGTGGNVFPAFVLDDWGREVRGIKLYEWVKANGEQFPRAEIFGYEEDGRETQCFLRELELYARLPAYLYKDKTQSVQEGTIIHSILLPANSIDTPNKITKPSEINFPLRAAHVNWWQIPFGSRLEDIKVDKNFPDPGY